jgi:hypothetical protein
MILFDWIDDIIHKNIEAIEKILQQGFATFLDCRYFFNVTLFLP